MRDRALDCRVCGKPVENLPVRRYRRLVEKGQLPCHQECRRMLEHRGAVRYKRVARTSEMRAIGGVAGVAMQWQTNRQQCTAGPLAKAIVRVELPSTYVDGGAVSDEGSE
jgi:hypothetical protein